MRAHETDAYVSDVLTSDSGPPPRRPWDQQLLGDELRSRACDWRSVCVLESTGSTNADASDAARDGAAHGWTVVAETQAAGRGRLGRSWSSPYGAGIAASVVVRPRIALDQVGWLPLLAGVAAADAVRTTTGIDAGLKWPNDVVVTPQVGGLAKLGGLLVERVANTDPVAFVVGLGLNIDLYPNEFPTPVTTSVRHLVAQGLGEMTSREVLLAEFLTNLAGGVARWQAAGGDPQRSGLRDAYVQICRTVGATVTVTLPGARTVTGIVRGIGRDGSLIVGTPTGTVEVMAGDVVHVRPA